MQNVRFEMFQQFIRNQSYSIFVVSSYILFAIHTMGLKDWLSQMKSGSREILVKPITRGFLFTVAMAISILLKSTS